MMEYLTDFWQIIRIADLLDIAFIAIFANILRCIALAMLVGGNADDPIVHSLVID